MRHKECRNTILIQLIAVARKRPKDVMREGKKHTGDESRLKNFYNHHPPAILPPITTDMQRKRCAGEKCMLNLVYLS